ncbi:7211_t:CDS:2 [Funneliformis mosseae]|uniref:7211_t:CDS:1 n=1 Tax=Funneliformis mosseae TaxID=27381 RepID=A0A9N8VVU9_FUNMO|nr:7211_t:CDS:2 [Funneliformis mosseae]
MRRAIKKPIKTTKTDATPIIETNVELQQNQQNDWFSKSMARKHLKYCTAALKELKKHPSAGLFLEPVDAIKYGIPDYFDIIKQPMDLGTVEAKLNALQYTTVTDFESDVRLIFSNCILYNGVDHPVSQQAKELESLFNVQLSSFPGGKKEVKPPVTEPSTKAAKSVKSTATAAAAAATVSSSPSSTVNLTIDESRPKRIIKAPAKDLPEAPQSGRRKKTKKNAELNFCRSVLRELKKKTHWPYAYPFYEPVDAEKLGVPDYYKVIKQPMDLTTINSKLENDQYASADEFEEDIRLMFRNCYTYNGVGSEVYNMGKTLENVFNKKWAEKPVPQSKQKGKTKTSRDDDSDTDSSSEEEYDDDEVPNPGLKKIQKQLSTLTSQLRQISNPKKSKSKKSRSGKASTSKSGSFNDPMDVDVEKKSLKRPRGGKRSEDEGLSNDQKAFLSSSIELLADTDMNQLIDLLYESGAPLQRDGGNYEIEIETLDVKTAKKVFDFVSKRINKQKRRPPPAKKARKHSNEEEQNQKILALERTLAKFNGSPSHDAFIENHYTSEEDSSDSQSSDSSGSESEDSGSDDTRKRKIRIENLPQTTSIAFKSRETGSFKVPKPVQPKESQTRSNKVIKRDSSQDVSEYFNERSKEQTKNIRINTNNSIPNRPIARLKIIEGEDPSIEERELLRKQILRIPDDVSKQSEQTKSIGAGIMNSSNINNKLTTRSRNSDIKSYNENLSLEVKGDDLARIMAAELDKMPSRSPSPARNQESRIHLNYSGSSNKTTRVNVSRTARPTESIGAYTRNRPAVRHNTSDSTTSGNAKSNAKLIQNTRYRSMTKYGAYKRKEPHIPPIPPLEELKPKKLIEVATNKAKPKFYDGGFETGPIEIKPLPSWCDAKPKQPKPEHQEQPKPEEKDQDVPQFNDEEEQTDQPREEENKEVIQHLENEIMKFMVEKAAKEEAQRAKELTSCIGWGEEALLMAEMEAEPFHLDRLAGSIWRRFREPFEDEPLQGSVQKMIIWPTVTPFGAIRTPLPSFPGLIV